VAKAMKIRTGFVSNSSASSFCIFGCCISSDDLEDPKKLGGLEHDEDIDEDTEDDELAELLSEKLEATEVPEGVDIERLQYGDGEVYVGMSPWQCRDDETMGEFKLRAKQTVTEFLDQNGVKTEGLKFSQIEECEGA
jgi:hypothetical protein